MSEGSPRVLIEKHAGRIWIRCPKGVDRQTWLENNDRCRNIGGSWSKRAMSWTFPLSREVCHAARRWFGADLMIGPDLAAWYRAEEAAVAGAKAILGLDPTVPAELPRTSIVAPRLAHAMKSRGYQTVAAAFASAVGSHGNFDEMGLGKTVEVLGSLIESGRTGNVLVIAPVRALASTWRREIDHWLEDYSGGAAYLMPGIRRIKSGEERTATRQQREEAIQAFSEWQTYEDGGMELRFLLVNPEMCEVYTTKDERGRTMLEANFAQLFDIEWDAILADEAHKYMLNTKGKNASLVGRGMSELVLKEDGIKIAMTGSPMKGRRKNMYTILNWMDPQQFSSKWNFIEDYFEPKPNAFSRYDYSDNFKDEVAEEEFNRLMSRWSIRRTADELHSINPAWAAPPIRYYERWCQMGPKQKRAYNQMLVEQTAAVQGGTIAANGILAILTRLKQLASCYGEIRNGIFRPVLPSCKFEDIVAFLDEIGIADPSRTEKVIIASQFTSMINMWEAALNSSGILTLKITGETPPADTERVRRIYQERPNYKVILLNTVAGGVSLSLDAATDVYIADETWVPDDQAQVEFRGRRASNVTKTLRVHYARTEETVEEDIMREVAEKDWAQRSTLDAARGIEWAKKTLGIRRIT